MIYEFFRMLGLITGYPFQLLFFKRRTFYEGGKRPRMFKGGKLIISNHFNPLDYVMNTFIVFPRKLNVVASEHAYKNKLMAFGMSFFGGIQANRVTRSMSFMSRSAEVIKKGQLVQIFPEGRNTPDGEMHPFFHSYLVIAHQAGCPILPIVSDGRYSLFKRASVIIGEEIDIRTLIHTDKPIPTRAELTEANAVVYAKMLALRAQLEEEKAAKRRRK